MKHGRTTPTSCRIGVFHQHLHRQHQAVEIFDGTLRVCAHVTTAICVNPSVRSVPPRQGDHRPCGANSGHAYRGAKPAGDASERGACFLPHTRVNILWRWHMDTSISERHRHIHVSHRSVSRSALRVAAELEKSRTVSAHLPDVAMRQRPLSVRACRARLSTPRTWFRSPPHHLPPKSVSTFKRPCALLAPDITKGSGLADQVVFADPHRISPTVTRNSRTSRTVRSAKHPCPRPPSVA